MDSGTNWTELPMDMLGVIASFLIIIEDFMAFRGVCKVWRSAATNDKFVSVSKVPLLLLAEKDDSNIREYYSLSKRKICMRSPLYGVRGKRIMDVGFGWILALTLKGKVCLLKPFSSSSARIELPNYKKFPGYSRTNPKFHFIRQALLTANPSETSDFMLWVTTTSGIGAWKNGDNKWTKSPESGYHMLYLNSRKMCTMVMRPKPGPSIMTWDPNDLSKPEQRVAVHNAPEGLDEYCKHYLVESTNGELLFITRNNTYKHDYVEFGADYFDLERVDFAKGELIEIDDLGNDAIFLGDNAAVSVDAMEFPGVLKPNCIYFTDDCILSHFPHKPVYKMDESILSQLPHKGRYDWDKGGGKDMGIYNVAEESIERFQVESLGRVCAPIWVFPSF